MVLRCRYALPLLGLALCATGCLLQSRVDPDFESLPAAAVSDDEVDAVGAFLANELGRTTGREADPPAGPARILLLSVGDPRGPAKVFVGRGSDVVDAAAEALAAARDSIDARSDPWIRADIIATAHCASTKMGLPESGDPRPLGLVRGRDGSELYLSEQLLAQGLTDRWGRIRWGSLELVEENEGGGFFCRFSTRGLYLEGARTVRLERGLRGSEGSEVEDLMAAVQIAASYLARMVRADGRFVYSYATRTDSVQQGYNILRHAGTLYSMLEIVAATGDPDVLAAAGRARDYLLRQIEPCGSRLGPARCVVELDAVKLGGNALAVIALAKWAEVTGSTGDLPLMRQLATWMRASQDESGAFAIHKLSLSSGYQSDFVSVYYPGEAILAFDRLYQIDPDPVWLDVASAAATYLIEGRDRGKSDSELPHDHWLLYGLNELYRWRAEPTFFEHAMRLAGAIVDAQQTSPRFPEWKGSFYRPPRATPSATRAEGLLAAYRLARDFGRPHEARRFLAAAELAVGFSLRNQFRPETAMYLPVPGRALGGVRSSLTHFDVRIDYVQHSVSSWLALVDAMKHD